MRAEWISVNDRLPDEEYRRYKTRYKEYGDDPEFIVMIESADVPTCLYYDGRFFKDHAGYRYPISHWANLPEPPDRSGCDRQDDDWQISEDEFLPWLSEE